MQGAGGTAGASGAATCFGGAGGGTVGAPGGGDWANAAPHVASATSSERVVPSEAARKERLSAARELVAVRDSFGICACTQFIKVKPLALAFGRNAQGHKTVEKPVQSVD